NYWRLTSTFAVALEVMFEEARRQPCPQVVVLRIKPLSDLVPPKVRLGFEDFIKYLVNSFSEVSHMPTVVNKNPVCREVQRVCRWCAGGRQTTIVREHSRRTP